MGLLDGRVPRDARCTGWEPLGICSSYVTNFVSLDKAGLSLGSGRPPAGAVVDACRPLGGKIVTWLILPVVICLSQRLSHACLSISNYTVKLRMAH